MIKDAKPKKFDELFREIENMKPGDEKPFKHSKAGSGLFIYHLQDISKLKTPEQIKRDRKNKYKY